MSDDKKKYVNLNAIKFSLFIKVGIAGFSFYYAVATEELSISLFYLVIAIVFSGLFVFQLDYYRKKKAEKGE